MGIQLYIQSVFAYTVRRMGIGELLMFYSNVSFSAAFEVTIEVTIF